MLVLVCGDRYWTNRVAIEREFNSHHLDPARDTIMHGAAKGADSLAGDVARERGFTVYPYPAEWNRFGRAAGPKRNQAMLDRHPDLVLAFHPDIAQSKGTANMVKIARKAGVRTEVFDR